MKRILLVLAASILILRVGDVYANENSLKVAFEDLERIILELKYIEIPTGPGFSSFRLTPDYSLSFGPEDNNKFYNYIDSLAAKFYGLRDSIKTGLFGLAPLWRGNQDKYMLWTADGKMLFTLLRDLPAWELVLNIFAVWSPEGDSLTLICLSDTTLLSGLGYASLKSICGIDSSSYVIIGETSGGDEGAYYRSVWFGFWQLPCDFRVFHQSLCRSSLCDKEQEIEYRIDEENLTAEIIKRERKVLECDEDTFQDIRFTDWYLIEVDTLDLMEMTRDFRN